MDRQKQLQRLLTPALLVLLSALVYLPMIGQLGLFKDDWYITFAGHTQGASIFRSLYDEDRPARAFVLGPAYALFGNDVLYYHLTGYLFRLLSGLCAYWILHLVWPKNRSNNLVMAALFLVYPGFLSQINPIDYQSQLCSLFMAMASIGLTLQAIVTPKLPVKIGLLVLSVLTGWFYLGLVEYFFGLEVMRFLLVFLLVRHEAVARWQVLFWKVFRRWLPAAAGPVGFLFWRLFLFTSERKATDIGQQVGTLSDAPIATGAGWLVSLLQDSFRVVVLAWGLPLQQLAFDLRLPELAVGTAIAALAACGLVWALGKPDQVAGKEEPEPSGWRGEAAVVGFLSVLAGLGPVAVSNRHITFPEYSRYTLASALGGVMIVVALLTLLADVRVRRAMFAGLAAVAALTHFANAVHAADETASMRDFWWQVSWRVPQFAERTTILAHYALTPIEEEYFIWGPANHIYYPSGYEPGKMLPPIAALVPNERSLRMVLSGQEIEFIRRRGIGVRVDYSNVIVITQPRADGCVHVIDGSLPELSSSDPLSVMLAAPHSKLELILTGAEPHRPPEAIFGPEPAHGWCFYYQAGSLARQRGDWMEVARLGDEARASGITPMDPIEWMPFLQAYARLGERKKVERLLQAVIPDPFIRHQACENVARQPAAAELVEILEESLCRPNPE